MEPDAERYISAAVCEYSDMVLRLAWQRLGSRADAEDVVQETFLRLLRMPVFDDPQKLKAWLIRVAVNRCKDLQKSAWHRKRAALPENIPSLAPERQGVMEEVRRLSAKYRDVVYLYYYEEYSIPEIAAILGRKPNTVNSWLTRARKKLKDLLEEGSAENDP